MLQITQYPGDDGFFLFYLNGQREVMTDTYHTKIEGAFEQPSWDSGHKLDLTRVYSEGYLLS